MKKDLTLVIMAAGMGSRFGGLKQIEPVGPNGEFIIDYSIYDAMRFGFNKVVFIIKEENYEIFKSTVGKRFEDKIKIEYVFQKTDDIPPFELAEERIKPWGTGHAIRSSRRVVNENFLVVNADDFYGKEAFEEGSKFLANNEDEFAIIGYKVVNTLSENGAAKRGILQSENGYLTSVIESSIIEKNGIIYANPLTDESDVREVEPTVLVSMNMLGFTPRIFDYLEHDIIEFLENNKNNINNCEFFIPDVLMNNKDNTKVFVKETDAKWFGMTYKEDLDEVKAQIKKYHEIGVYPQSLWD